MGPDYRAQVAALSATLGKLELSLGAIQESIVWTGKNGNIHWCNASFDRLIHKPHLEPLGAGLLEVLPLAIQDGLNPIESALAGPPNVTQVREYRHFGDDRTFELSTTRVKLATDTDIVIVIRDVTARKRQDEAVSRLASIAESSNDAIWVAGFDRRVTFWNTAAEQLYEYKADEILDKSVDLLLPQDRQGEFTDLFGRLERGERIRHLETTRRSKQGKQVEVSLTLSIIFDRRGAPIGVSAISRDMTQRKQRDLELRETNLKLQEAYRELETFSYSVSHDLRSPVRRILNYVQLFAQRYESRLDKEGLGLLETVSTSAKAMAALIEALLSLSKASASPLQRERIDLSSAFSDTINRLKETEPNRQVDVAVAPDLVVYADPPLTAVLLENLANNAWKFTGKRGRAKIELGAITESAETIFYVRDNGVGFEMGLSGRLFAPFERLHSRRDYPGSGIGLATARRIVMRHKGRIWAKGEPGKGATIFFTLSDPADKART